MGCCHGKSKGAPGSPEAKGLLAGEGLAFAIDGDSRFESKSSGRFEAQYKKLEKVGHGSSSECFRCTNRRTGRVCAVKVLNKRKLSMYNPKLVPQLLREITLLRRIKHRNVIDLLDVFQDADSIYVVMQYLSGGELFDYVIDRGALSERDASSIMRQVLDAMVYLHEKGIIHRDLKPENLLLTNREGPVEVKIIDFGSSVQLEAHAQAKTMLGTLGYVAPEVLKGKGYSTAVDMWAVGVIAFVLLCGCFPFNQSSIHTVRAQDYKLHWPRWTSSLSNESKDFVRSLVQYDPRRRFSARDARAHPWISGGHAPNLSLQSPGRLHDLTKHKKRRERVRQPKFGAEAKQARARRAGATPKSAPGR